MLIVKSCVNAQIMNWHVWTMLCSLSTSATWMQLPTTKQTHMLCRCDNDICGEPVVRLDTPVEVT